MPKLKVSLLLFGILGWLLSSPTYCIELKYSPISLDQYLEIVRQSNSYNNGASLDVQTAMANKEAQSLYQFSPSVSYARGAYQNQTPYAPYNTPQSSTYGLSFTIEGWGKRSAREKLAQAETEASTVQLEKTRTTIELNALNTYIDTLRLAQMLKSYNEALRKLKSLQAGAKTVDAERFLNFYKISTEKDLSFAALNLLNYSGDSLQDLPYPKGNLNFPAQEYDAEELIVRAQSQRMEVLSLQSSIDVADKNISLKMQNRNVNVFPYISQTRTPQYQYSNGVSYTLPASPVGPSQTLTSPGTTYTAQNSISAGITIPIPINNYFQSADIVSAANQKLQYEMRLRDLKVQIRVQVLQALMQYSAAKDILSTAQGVYEATTKNPNKNPVLATMDSRDKEGALLDAKTNHLKALINLWRQSGNYAVPAL
ncbi:TolC family protein [Polynucleobacter sp. MWH-Creno-3A4]|uniref:TolC family protein n=1 Tax=Polynucleobacter sp. MWH-Creno-3A4 TaxID=1855886 RepID=UPI001C0B5368|nr:TolC family protein [Polynucleobacter sp. MWH-Creno-3A4]MBU3605327.1 TolC family protein [Polynucleobacter sp. MWH-Creno-3A4]